MSVRLAPARAATPEALPEIVGLLERVFPRPRPWAPDIEWQYLRNPIGPTRYVNAYAESGTLIAHYALLPTPPLADPSAAFVGTYFAVNTAVDPKAPVPGLMVATARALFRQLEQEGPTLLLGVGNENAAQGLVRLLGFRPLGRLSLTVHPPGTLPGPQAPRALAHSPAHLAWRTHRPGVRAYGDRLKGALTVRLRHRGIPLDAVLTMGLPSDSVQALQLPRPAPWSPRLYATSGPTPRGGMAVPDRLRPSPLEYCARVLGDAAQAEPVLRYLATRRFEFLDFDVV